MKNNFVAKHMNDWNKSVVMKNRKKELKKGNEKHKHNYKKGEPRFSLVLNFNKMFNKNKKSI